MCSTSDDPTQHDLDRTLANANAYSRQANANNVTRDPATMRDPLYPQGNRPRCLRRDGNPVYLGGLCSACYALVAPYPGGTVGQQLAAYEADQAKGGAHA